MIFTITLNVALDRTLWVDKIEPDESNRIEKEQRYAGGKGVDVSKVLTTLGLANRTLGFVGGFAGDELEGRLLNEGVACDFVRISQETRTNIIVNDMSTEQQMLFSAKGPVIQPYELMRVIRQVEQLIAPAFIVISGSLPADVTPEIYRKIIDVAKNKGATVLMDTAGDALRVGIQSLPHIIKPNIHELSHLVQQTLTSLDDILQAATRIHQQGVEIVLVSMGAKGILLVTENEQYLASPPHVEVQNTVGAGDSAVAGFVYGLVEGKSHREALTFAVAAGTATTLRSGTALCKKEDIFKLAPKINVSSVPLHVLR